jgi:hypothetical protein
MAKHKVFKGEKKGDTLRVCYLYRDGHVVSVFERRELGATLSYVKIAKNVGADINGGDFLRIVFHDPALLVAFTEVGKTCYISAHVPAVCHGSENTKKQGLEVGYLSIGLPGYGTVSIHETPLISNGITIQNSVSEKSLTEEKFDPTVTRWGYNDSVVVKVYE